MISIESNLIGFIDDRLSHMLEAPGMWGSSESVELQVLQLLEIRSLVLGPPDHWRHVQTDYERFIAGQFPGAPPTTLTALLDQEPDKVIPLLARFVAEQRHGQPDRNLAQIRNAWEIAMVEAFVTKIRAAVESERERPGSYDLRPVKVSDEAA